MSGKQGWIERAWHTTVNPNCQWHVSCHRRCCCWACRSCQADSSGSWLFSPAHDSRTLELKEAWGGMEPATLLSAASKTPGRGRAEIKGPQRHFYPGPPQKSNVMRSHHGLCMSRARNCGVGRGMVLGLTGSHGRGRGEQSSGDRETGYRTPGRRQRRGQRSEEKG